MSFFDDASLVLIPSGYKASKVYSVKPTDGTGDLTFTRSLDTATRVGPDGLIEKVRTNLVLNSATFVTQTITVTANPHTLSFTGTGTIVITGVGSGTLVGTGVNDRVSLAITTTAGGLILTLTGTATLAQLETGDIATPYIATAGAAVSVGMLANVPRLDYEGGGCPKLLLEPQRTNLITFSEQINNAAYSKTGTTISANVATSPAGFTDADKVVEEAVTSGHFLLQSLTLAAGANTFSVFAKAGERNLFLFRQLGVGLNATFNLATGTLGTIEAGLTATMEDYGNGWYRCTATFTATAGTNSLRLYVTNANNSTSSYLGDGTSGLFLYGAQVELGSYATSYIPTLAAAVTRSADAASKTGISALIGQTEGTLFVEFQFNYSDSTTQVLFKANQTTDANSAGIEVQGTTITGIVNSGGVNIATIAGTIATGTIKAALAYKTNDMALYVNGTQVGVDTSGSIAFAGVVDILTIGQFLLNGSPFFPASRPFNQALLFKTRLTNAALAELTA